MPGRRWHDNADRGRCARGCLYFLQDSLLAGRASWPNEGNVTYVLYHHVRNRLLYVVRT